MNSCKRVGFSLDDREEPRGYMEMKVSGECKGFALLSTAMMSSTNHSLPWTISPLVGASLRSLIPVRQ